MANKILIVDDDQDLLRGLSVRLKASGFEVIFAADAMYAVSNARKERPDLIILDIGLPGGDGFLVMDRLKSNSTLASIPIIILSARDPQVNREKALEHGAVAFLQKPADNFVLMATIQKVLGNVTEDSAPAEPEQKPSRPTALNTSRENAAPEIDEIIQNQVPKQRTAYDQSDSNLYRQMIQSTPAQAPDLEQPTSSLHPQVEQQKRLREQKKHIPKPTSKKKAKSILVVDDDHDLLLGMSVRLMAYGYNVFFTYDVVSAIAKAKKVKPDLIILDIGLPGGDGFTVMERMQKIPSISKIPVIILTAREPRKNRQKAIEMGAIGFFQKPANNNELISAIRKVLK